jgi:hypothetical protein
MLQGITHFRDWIVTVERKSSTVGLALLVGSALPSILASPALAQRSSFVPGTLVVSRIHFDRDTNPARSGESFPFIFNDPNVSGVQGSIFLDSFRIDPWSPRLRSLAVTDVTNGAITTSFSSKSEGSLHLSVDGRLLTYMGYMGPPGAEGVSNSETTGATLTTNTAPTFDRAVATITADGAVTLAREINAFSGDNPRGVITIDGTQFYMAGNADSSLNSNGTGPGTTIGIRLGSPLSVTSTQLGTYVAADRPDESKKQHIKDNNWRGVGIFNGNLYVSKGSGGNGDDGIFQVQSGTANGLPTGGTANTIVQLLGTQATSPSTGAASPLTPFGFFFADSTTLYVADEGNATITTTDASGNSVTSLVSDPLAGLQKWVLAGGVWQLVYVLQAGLHLNEPDNVPGYPVPTFTTGLRNMTGRVNGDGTATLFAITAQTSTISGGEPDPTKLVMITDVLAATHLPTGDQDHDDVDRGRDDRDGNLEKFVTLQASRAGEVFRGVAFAPNVR